MPLGKLHHLVPGIVAIDAGTDDERRARAAIETLGDGRDQIRIRMRRSADRPFHDRLGRAVPIVDGNRHEGRPAGRLHGDVIRARNGGGHVFAAGGLVAPLHVRFGQLRRLRGEEKRLVRKDRARLLPGGDDERRAVPVGGEDVAHRMADTGRRVEVDERGVARGLRVAVSHADDDRFLQAEDVAEIVREVAEERQLGRAGVAEDGGHPQLTQQTHNGFTNGRHCRAALWSNDTVHGKSNATPCAICWTHAVEFDSGVAGHQSTGRA